MKIKQIIFTITTILCCFSCVPEFKEKLYPENESRQYFNKTFETNGKRYSAQCVFEYQVQSESQAFIVLGKTLCSAEISVNGRYIGAIGIPEENYTDKRRLKYLEIPEFFLNKKNINRIKITYFGKKSSDLIYTPFLTTGKNIYKIKTYSDFFNCGIYLIFGAVSLLYALIIFFRKKRISEEITLGLLSFFYFAEMGSYTAADTFTIFIIAKASLLPLIITAMILYCRLEQISFTKKNIYLFYTPALIQFIAMLFYHGDNSKVMKIFVLSSGFALCIITAAFIYFTVTTLKNKKFKPTALPFAAALGTGIYDSIFLLQGKVPDILAEGYGIIIILIHLAALNFSEITKKNREIKLYRNLYELKLNSAAQLINHASAALFSLTVNSAGMYMRLKHSEQEISSYSRLSSGTTEALIELTDGNAETVSLLLSLKQTLRTNYKTIEENALETSAAVTGMTEKLDGFSRLESNHSKITDDVSELESFFMQKEKFLKTIAEGINSISAILSAIKESMHLTSDLTRQIAFLAINARIKSAGTGSINEFRTIAESIGEISAKSGEINRNALKKTKEADALLKNIIDNYNEIRQLINISAEKIANTSEDLRKRADENQSFIIETRKAADKLNEITERNIDNTNLISRSSHLIDLMENLSSELKQQQNTGHKLLNNLKQGENRLTKEIKILSTLKEKNVQNENNIRFILQSAAEIEKRDRGA